MRIGTATDGTQAIVVVEDGEGSLRPWLELYPTVPVGSAIDALVEARWGQLPPPSACEPLGLPWALTVPLRPRRNVICVGTNYAAHVAEFAAFAGTPQQAAPAFPVVFTKVPEALCGPADDIVVDPIWSPCLDYEVELAVVIGHPGGHIQPEDALGHVAGYTVINDTTARDRQKAHNQWFLGKSLVAASPIGPVVVTPDELPPLDEVELRAIVDDELRQKAVVRDMIFDIPSLIATISEVFPLERGDVIATGTPSGVGISFDPPRYLVDGGRVTCTITGIGSVSNRVRFDGWHPGEPAAAAPAPSGDLPAEATAP